MDFLGAYCPIPPSSQCRKRGGLNTQCFIRCTATAWGTTARRRQGRTLLGRAFSAPPSWGPPGSPPVIVGPVPLAGEGSLPSLPGSIPHRLPSFDPWSFMSLWGGTLALLPVLVTRLHFLIVTSALPRVKAIAICCVLPCHSRWWGGKGNSARCQPPCPGPVATARPTRCRRPCCCHGLLAW